MWMTNKNWKEHSQKRSVKRNTEWDDNETVNIYTFTVSDWPRITSPCIFPIAVRSIDCWKSIWLVIKECVPLDLLYFYFTFEKVKRTPYIAHTLLTVRSNEAKQTQCRTEDAPVWEPHHHHNGWHAATTLLYSYGRAFRIQYELCMRFTMMSASHETLLMRLLLRFMRVRLQWMLRNAQKFGITRFCTLLTIDRHTCRRVSAGRGPSSMWSMHFILPLDLSSIKYVCGQWSLHSIFIFV